jgi:hypothetical protein
MPPLAVTLRPLIRDAMRAAPKKPWTPAALLSVLRDIHADAQLDDVSAALTWNQSKGHVDFEHNAERGVDYWTLTARGKAAQ